MYKIEINFGGILGKKVYRFSSLDKAQNFADKYFEKTGDIVAISSVRNYRRRTSKYPMIRKVKFVPSEYARKDGRRSGSVLGQRYFHWDLPVSRPKLAIYGVRKWLKKSYRQHTALW